PPRGAVEAVLFDLDGTLLDSGPLIIRTYQDVLREELGIEASPDDILAHFGRTLAETFAAFTPNRARIPQLVARYQTRNLELHDQLARPVPGAVEAVAALRSAGLRLAVVTTKRREMAERGLRLMGLAGAFDAVIAFEDVSAHKPDPEGIFRALDHMAVPPEAALMVGDTPADLLAARRAGVTPVAVGWALAPGDLLVGAGPAAVIGDWTDLLALAGVQGRAAGPRTSPGEAAYSSLADPGEGMGACGCTT
ncbi:MAG TPA: HAD-IA family hydrolase, partial [Bacillota bacterium]